MKKAPLVSVITLNYNGMRYVDQYLNSILKTNYPHLEVVIVDNNSTDGSLEFLKKKLCGLPRFKIIANCVNQGFAEGNNTGYRQIDSDAKYIVFLNLDTEQDSEWIAELVKAMESDPSIGVAQCKLLQIRCRRLIDRTGGVIDDLGYSYNYGEGEVDSGQYDSMKKVFYADGAALAVRKDVVDEVLIDGSVFDSDYFAYHEEVDLCWRARLKGYKVIFVPNSKVYHARGGLTKNYETSPQLLFHHTKNRISSLIKNYSWSNLLKGATLLIYLEFLRSLLVLKQARQIFVATLQTTFWIVKNFGKIWKKRLYVQHSLRKVPDSEITRYMRRLDIGYLRHKWMRNMRKARVRADLLNIVKKEGLINDPVNFGDLRVSEAAVRTNYFTNEQLNSLQREMYIIFFKRRISAYLETRKLISRPKANTLHRGYRLLVKAVISVH